MKKKPHFLIITHAPHKLKGASVYAYAPYIKEMNLWANHVGKITVIAPLSKEPLTTIDTSYSHENIQLVAAPLIAFTSFITIFLSLLKIPYIFFVLFRYMLACDHIHLRCPGNMGMAGCIMQVLFPEKKKTAKYAGNWDPNAVQPWTYKLQRSLLSNTFWTKNMQVLVYGDWPSQTKNILPFFTASYKVDEVSSPTSKLLSRQEFSFNEPWRFVFVGALTKGKRPLYAVQLVDSLVKNGIDCSLELYGDGEEIYAIETFISTNNCEAYIRLLGNREANEVKKGFQKSHFQILPSKSEGWPKVVAEAMFWGCIPFVTPVSCVPWMLDSEKRGVLLSLDLAIDINKIKTLLENKGLLEEKSKAARKWSRQYTLDAFELEISKLI